MGMGFERNPAFSFAVFGVFEYRSCVWLEVQRFADNEMLKITFRRCYNHIHGNEGMPKDAAFWQFLYLIFCKMHDENLRSKQRKAWRRRFWAGPKEQFEEKGQKEIRKRIEDLFAEVKKQCKNIFRGNEEISVNRFDLHRQELRDGDAVGSKQEMVALDS